MTLEKYEVPLFSERKKKKFTKVPHIFWVSSSPLAYPMGYFDGAEQEGIYRDGIFYKLNPYFVVKGWMKVGRGTNSIA